MTDNNPRIENEMQQFLLLKINSKSSILNNQKIKSKYHEIKKLFFCFDFNLLGYNI